MYYYILSVITIIICIVLVTAFIYYKPSKATQLWNKIVYTDDDTTWLNGITTLQYGFENHSIKLVDNLLRLHHDEILEEINPLIKEINNDNIFITNRTPILHSIIAMIPQIITARIIVHKPGVIMNELQRPFKFIQRYCYGLRVAAADIGLNLDSYEVQWRPRVGYIWNSAISHTMWNHTAETRVILEIDMMQKLSLPYALGSGIIYKAHPSSHTAANNIIDSAPIELTI